MQMLSWLYPHCHIHKTLSSVRTIFRKWETNTISILTAELSTIQHPGYGICVLRMSWYKLSLVHKNERTGHSKISVLSKIDNNNNNNNNKQQPFNSPLSGLPG